MLPFVPQGTLSIFFKKVHAMFGIAKIVIHYFQTRPNEGNSPLKENIWSSLSLPFISLIKAGLGI